VAGDRDSETDSAPRIRRREHHGAEALPPSLAPVLRRVYAARGVLDAASLDLSLARLLPPEGMLGLDAAAGLLADAVQQQAAICIAGDYDADGATSTALMLRALRRLGAQRLDHVVPDRFNMGYGLSRPLVDLAVSRGAQVLVTVDSGIASVDGVAYARAQGLIVIITDHHLAGPELPAADAIVNPNQPGDGFPSKHLAGVGVAFYVMAALRSELRRRGQTGDELRMADLLDLVALGTVADVVKLDHNNRILVAQGLARIRAGRACAGIRALLTAGGRDPAHTTSMDLGFVVGPRLNAAGRLEDMGQGVACLLCDEEEQALGMARALDALNRARRDIEGDMLSGADDACLLPDAVGVTLFDPAWHEGVVGLVASRVKEARHRPVIAFAPAQQEGLLKGSARSISGLHVRDVLALVDARHPGLIERFGGHAMAAGLSLQREHLATFAAAFDGICRDSLSADALDAVLDSDGELAAGELGLDTALALEQAGPWGQGFPEPAFDGRFEAVDTRVVGERHVRYELHVPGAPRLQAIDFGGVERMRTGPVHLLYQLDINRWRGNMSPQLRIRSLAPAT
jgi:single-stranded-DNA-specific exonuclease